MWAWDFYKVKTIELKHKTSNTSQSTYKGANVISRKNGVSGICMKDLLGSFKVAWDFGYSRSWSWCGDILKNLSENLR